jgi:membrane protease YdiL (CAAX protease family)
VGEVGDVGEEVGEVGEVGRGGEAMASARRQAIAFVVLAYVLSWSWWIPLAVRGDVVHPGQGWPTHLIGLLGPALSAVVVTAATGGRREVVELLGRCVARRASRLAWLAVAAMAALAVVAAVVADRPSDALVYSGAPRIGLAVVPYVLVVNGFGEELGWRGFLVPRLEAAGRSLRDTSVIVWLVWGAWHLPMFWVVANFRDFGVAGTAGWAVGLFFGSVFLAWLVGEGRGSVLVVALWHTAYNLATATEADAGAVAAVATGAVVVATVWIMRTTGGGTGPTAAGGPSPAGP